MAGDSGSNRKKWTGRALVLLGLIGLVFVFVKYNPGPYVGFWEALFDCTPLALIVAVVGGVVAGGGGCRGFRSGSSLPV